MIRLALAAAAGYAALAMTGDLRDRPVLWLTLYALLYGACLMAARWAWNESGKTALKIILGAAVVFRLILLPATPVLSDDIYRYLWEGRVQLHGINPYAHAPSDPGLSRLRDKAWEEINYKELPAIYPPVSQWANAAGAALGMGLAGVKLIFLCADLVLAWLLVAFLRARGLPPGRVVLYAWNPLVVVEVAGSGHNDVLAVCLLIAATLAIIKERRGVSTLALGLAAGAKFLPLLMSPLLFVRKQAVWVFPAALIMSACFIPYLSAGSDLFFSAGQFAGRWRNNESLFAVVEAGIEGSGVAAPLKKMLDGLGVNSLYAQPHMLARGAAAVIVMLVLAWLVARRWRGQIEPERALSLFTGAILLFSPVVHPWYLIWILPWQVLHPSPAWLALGALAPLSYLPGAWPRLAEYVPFFLLLAWGFARRRDTLSP